MTNVSCARTLSATISGQDHEAGSSFIPTTLRDGARFQPGAAPSRGAGRSPCLGRAGRLGVVADAALRPNTGDRLPFDPARVPHGPSRSGGARVDRRGPAHRSKLPPRWRGLGPAGNDLSHPRTSPGSPRLLRTSRGLPTEQSALAVLSRAAWAGGEPGAGLEEIRASGAAERAGTGLPQVAAGPVVD